MLPGGFVFMKKKSLVFLAALLAMALMLAGCTQNAPVSTKETATPAPATAAPTDALTEAPAAEAATDAVVQGGEKPGMLATINGVDVPIDEALAEYS